MVAYERALEWQELFDIAILSKVDSEGIKDLAYRVAGSIIVPLHIFSRGVANQALFLSEELTSKKRYAEAATVLADYAKDVREAVIALVQGNHFAEAKRIVCATSIINLEHPAYFL